jgi:hypothetical protein
MAQNTIRHSNRPIAPQPQISPAQGKSGWIGRVKKALGEAFSGAPAAPKQAVFTQDKYVKGTPMRVAAERYLGRVTAGRAGIAVPAGSVSDAQLVAYLNHISLTGDPIVPTQKTNTSVRKVA